MFHMKIVDYTAPYYLETTGTCRVLKTVSGIS